MSPTLLDAIADLNPLTDDGAERLAIAAAEDDMLARIVTAGDQEVAPVSAPAPPRRRSRPALAVAGLAAAALPVIAVIAVLPTGRQSDRRSSNPPPGPLTTGALDRLAGASPRVLLQKPGWPVSYADEQSMLWGELDYRHAGTRTGGALNWFPASEMRGYIEDRGSEAAVKTTARLLGTTAHVFQSKAAVRGAHTFTAIWAMGPRGLMFEAVAHDLPAFMALLGHLHVVDRATWLKALPASVVRTADRGETIRKMLKGVPLPPGFDAAQIPGATLVRDRYQLGTAVSGTVACEWFARWGRARKAGDQAGVNAAIAAMATAVHWPVIKQLNRTGAWGSVLTGYAKAMRSGRWYGRPLLGDVNSGLGCSSEWHVKLGAAPLTPTSLTAVNAGS